MTFNAFEIVFFAVGMAHGTSGMTNNIIAVDTFHFMWCLLQTRIDVDVCVCAFDIIHLCFLGAFGGRSSSSAGKFMEGNVTAALFYN